MENRIIAGMNTGGMNILIKKLVCAMCKKEFMEKDKAQEHEKMCRREFMAEEKQNRSDLKSAVKKVLDQETGKGGEGNAETQDQKKV